MTDMPLDLDLMPDTIADRDDIESKIREALADAPAHTTVDLPGLTLTLDFCAYPDGTPIWDAPLNGKTGGVRATRADGEVLDLTIDGQTWDELADALVTFMEDWPATLGSRLTIVRDAARRRKRLANELNLAKAAEREAVVAARAAGATGYKLSKITGLGQTTISRWTREKGHQSED